MKPKLAIPAFLLFLIFFPVVTAFSAPVEAVYISYFIENGSPLDWEVKDTGEVEIQLLYDHERNSPNRACIHWNFLVEAPEGSTQTLILKGFENIWNGQPGSAIEDETSCYISSDGESWKGIDTEKLSEGELKIVLEMESSSMQVARLQPYRISDLDKLYARLVDNPLAEIIPIGRTVCGQELKVIRAGRTDSTHSVVIRARAHPWEPGGNWVVEGLLNGLVEQAEGGKYLEKYCLYILPMANMDGVFYGRTRFNARGMDLNRKWDKSPDPELSPENHAFESFLQSLIDAGSRPDLAIDFHNDASGGVHISRPEGVDLDKYLEKMKVFENLLRANTCFTEKVTGGEFRNPGSFGEGLLERFGIDAFIFELNANWIEGLSKQPEANDWIRMGEDLDKVFYLYFQDDINR